MMNFFEAIPLHILALVDKRVDLEQAQNLTDHANLQIARIFATEEMDSAHRERGVVFDLAATYRCFIFRTPHQLNE